MEQRGRRLQLEAGGEDRLGALRHRRPDEYARRQDAHHLADHRWVKRVHRVLCIQHVMHRREGHDLLDNAGKLRVGEHAEHDRDQDHLWATRRVSPLRVGCAPTSEQQAPGAGWRREDGAAGAWMVEMATPSASTGTIAPRRSCESSGVMKIAPSVVTVVIITESATSPRAMYVHRLDACGGGKHTTWSNRQEASR